MTDIVERLRSKEINAGLCGEAADEIERLNQRVAELEADIKHWQENLAAFDEIERLRGDVVFAKRVMAAKDDEIERLKAKTPAAVAICVTCGKPAIGRCEATSSIYHRTLRTEND
jgi:septation ring formation regulator EzrA